ncbi:hypothetical protein B484DRAFT_402055 [Ochromonadaceae sp. CCMP2298]|nr:hypothetical protein B484DRAFT_402055 [Ochromonadaceae sp. CCMP2298]
MNIKPDRISDFLIAIEEDAVGSRTKENGGCLRFDVIVDTESPAKFTLYEAYKNTEAVAFHKASAHYQVWTDFKMSGGVVSQSVVKGSGLSFTQ